MKKLTYESDTYPAFMQALPSEAKPLFNKFINKYNDDQWSHKQLQNWLKVLKPYGITFDYDLSLEPYDITLTLN